MRLLIVDDNALVRQALAVSLRRHHHVRVADGVDEALAIVEHEAIDVVLSDVDLQDAAGRDGLWLLDRVTALGTRGLGLTGHRVSHDVHTILHKPCSLARLRSAIEDQG